ncbi:TIGR00730 family Rossman fold protein [Ureibacillus composti]
MRVAVYCGSALGKSTVYAEKARELGTTLANEGIGLVYGGSNYGLMGIVADAALEANGEVVGVMPTHLQTKERVHTALTEIHIVDTMHVRKAKMVDLADAFIALPGGCGTLDEYFEVFTWSQIGLHDKPVILYNINGFYDALIQHFNKMIEEGFIREEQRQILQVATSVEGILTILTPPDDLLIKKGS